MSETHLYPFYTVWSATYSLFVVYQWTRNKNKAMEKYTEVQLEKSPFLMYSFNVDTESAESDSINVLECIIIKKIEKFKNEIQFDL